MCVDASDTCVTRVRVFAAQDNSPQSVWQTTWDDHNGWDGWGKIYSGGASTQQPVPAVAGGDVTLFTHTSGTGIVEQMVR